MPESHHPLRPSHRRQISRKASPPPLRPTTPPQFSTPSSRHLRTPIRSTTTTLPHIDSTYQQPSFPASFLSNADDNASLPFRPEDIDPDITTSFSPSKARARARQTAHLAVLRSWLTSLTHHANHHHQQQHDQERTHEKLTSLLQAWEAEYLSLQSDTSAHLIPPSSSSSSAFTTTTTASFTDATTTTTTRNSLSTLASQSLEALQALMTWQTSTQEFHRLLDLAKREELDFLLSSEAHSHSTVNPVNQGNQGEGDEEDLLSILESHLSPSAMASLTSLAEIAVGMGISLEHHQDEESILSKLAEPIVELTRYLYRLQMAVRDVSVLQGRVEVEVEGVRGRLEGLMKQKKEEGDEDEGKETVQMVVNRWGREERQVGVKILEYRERIATLERMKRGDDKGERRIEEVVEMLEAVERKKRVVSALEEEVKCFHGLPPDLDASREEVRRARAELQRLRIKREEMFERIAERG